MVEGRTSNEKIGAVLVVGGGIGGMQAALDLAEAGFKVYLVDEKTAIGGVMAQLDKTFPTNDCSMCILSPKLVECGRHLNIEIITGATVERVEGEPGNFTVTIRQRPRFVELDKCTGCGDCAAKCPIELPDEFNAGLSTRKAIYKLYPQATPNAFAIEKAGTAPCRDACPAHQRAQGYIALIKERRFEDAYRVIREDNPFPAICGRICNHPCEEKCTRGKLDAPVAIRALKRFVADWMYHRIGESGIANQESAIGVQDSKSEVRGAQVAIIGAGPAGLTAAQDLVKLGHRVTVFEALPVAGGMMRVGIPEYRLPRDILQWEIEQILAQGVELRLNTRVEDVNALFEQGYNAVFIATGAHQGRKLRIPGADLPDVLINTDFLRRVNLGEKIDFSGRRVLVLGGGNVACDCARTALRLGAKEVHMACLESREKMPAHPWEIEEAEEEGVVIHPSRTFKEITSQNGKVTGLRCVKVEFRGFLPDGRPDMDEIPGTEHILPADVVIFAIGQRPDLGFLDGRIQTTRRGTIAVDPETLATSRPGVFAGGDVVTGTAFVIDAIAAAHKAARSIDRYLRGEEGVEEPVLQPVVEISEEELARRLAEGLIVERPRVEIPTSPPEERKKDFREINLTLSEEEAVAEAERCLSCGVCSECLECVYACKADAINHDMTEKWLNLKVGAVILCPGVEAFDARQKTEYGYGRFANVLTSIEFERLLSASGPFGGHLQRPSDGKEPRRIAWLQCVGSRDISCGRPYCSSVCCMYAVKEAIIAKEHLPGVEATIFFLDARAFGKDFERYYERAKSEYGVRFVRCLVSSVEERPESKNLSIRYVDEDGSLREEEFDLVVLSVGLGPSEEAKELARRLGVELNEYGFCATHEFAPTQTSRPGIFVAGAFREPKDIPETVVEASCAAAEASALLAPARGTLTRVKEYPPERDVSEEEPRIGVFICHCGINIGGVVDVPAVVEYAKTLPGVVYAEDNLYTCSQDTQERIKQRIAEHRLNRVVVASCTPRTHEPLFQDTLREAGLNPHLFEMANIREQDSWVHPNEPEMATEKAKELVAMAVAKARLLRPIHRPKFGLVRSALVIGGGIAGMTAALSIADQGYQVYLVEKEAELGGNLRHIHWTVQGNDPQKLLRETVQRVQNHPLITVLTGAEVEEVSGYVGNFAVKIRRFVDSGFVNSDESTNLQPPNSRVYDVGAIVVATGAREYRPREYLYGQDPRVVTQRELEEMLANGNWRPEAGSQIVMIQCVGSRDEEHPYCSRVCCSQAVKNALKIKEINPDAQIFILYRDIRTYGFREDYYRRAREAGVMFLRYEPEDKPKVSAIDERLRVEVPAPVPGGKVVLEPDLLVLSAGIVPNDGNEELSRLLRVPLNQDGFFLEAHAKLRPLDFAADGIYLCGLAHSPKAIGEAIAQARGVGIKVAALLSKEEIEAAPIVATVNPRLCAGCGLCVEVCPYDARVINEETHVAEVIEVLCQGCGACVAACPNGASQQKGFEQVQLLAMLDAALVGG